MLLGPLRCFGSNRRYCAFVISLVAIQKLSRNSTQWTGISQDGSAGRSASEEDLFYDVAPSLGYTTVRTTDEMNAAPKDKPLLGLFGGDGRAAQSALDDRNIPNALDRLVARGDATIGGKDASDPALSERRFRCNPCTCKSELDQSGWSID